MRAQKKKKAPPAASQRSARQISSIPITVAVRDFAAENPVNYNRVSQDHREGDQSRSVEHEILGRPGCLSIGDRHAEGQRI